MTPAETTPLQFEDAGGPRVLQEALSRGLPSASCSLDAINRDLRLAWGIVRSTGRAMRHTPKDFLSPFPLEFDTYCARHFFLSIDEVADKVVRATTVDSLRWKRSNRSWHAQVCKTVQSAREEMRQLYGDEEAAGGYRQGWRGMAHSLELDAMAPCMEFVAGFWWRHVGQPMSALCQAHRDIPTEKAMMAVVPQLSFTATMLLPRAKRFMARFAKRCIAGEDGKVEEGMTRYQMRNCRALNRAVVEHRRVHKSLQGPFAPEAEQAGTTLLPDVPGFRMRVTALAMEAADARMAGRAGPPKPDRQWSLEGVSWADAWQRAESSGGGSTDIGVKADDEVMRESPTPEATFSMDLGASWADEWRRTEAGGDGAAIGVTPDTVEEEVLPTPPVIHLKHGLSSIDSFASFALNDAAAGLEPLGSGTVDVLFEGGDAGEVPIIIPSVDGDGDVGMAVA